MCKGEYNMNIDGILMPINPDFIEVFSVFINKDQLEKIRAQNVRQYTEGIIDLLLKDKIIPLMKENEQYDGLRQKKILGYLDAYDSDISAKIRKIFEIGGKASHFRSKVSEEEVSEIIELAIHIVEDIFVKYFTEDKHHFGTEEIFTIFSMLPLKNRIYILEKLSKTYINVEIVDRLSLAYFKNGEMEKAIDLLKSTFDSSLIDESFFHVQINKLKILQKNLEKVISKNKGYDDSGKFFAKTDGNVMIVGFPSSNNIFDTKKAIAYFEKIGEECKHKYPEFMRLFFFLMQTDDRHYENIE